MNWFLESYQYLFLFLSVVCNAIYDGRSDNIRENWDAKKDALNKLWNAAHLVFLLIGSHNANLAPLILWYGLTRLLLFDAVYRFIRRQEMGFGAILKNNWIVKIIKVILGKEL